MTTEKAKTHRYPGVKPFTENERHVFYGRENDTKKLYQLINLEKLVLLYGKSGLGKSSLLNAGVIPLFDEEGDFNTIKIRFGAFSNNAQSPIAVSLFKLPQAERNPVVDKLGAGFDTLWLRMKCIQAKEAANNKTYILVFDQFEELFTYDKEDIKQFKRQLADLLYSKVPGYISKSITNRLKEDPGFLTNEEMEFLYRQPAVKVVISIRSDRLSMLNSLADYLPDIQKNYYELKPLSHDSAIDSIVKPAIDNRSLYVSPSFEYSQDCISNVLDYLTQNGQKSIETFQLQTVCQYAENLAIENKLPFDQQRKTLLVEPQLLGDLQNIFRTQYDMLIGKIEPKEKQLSARLLIENKLIIDGNRVSLPDVVVLKEKGIDNELIRYLHDTYHLLRSEPNTTGGISYELSHDTLVAPILKAKKEREERERLASLEAERQEELREQKEKAEKEQLELAKTRRRLRLVYALLGLAFVATITAISMYVNATKQKSIAVNEKQKADKSADDAKNQQMNAEQQRASAELSERHADSQKRKAELSEQEAEKEKASALLSERRAELSQQKAESSALEAKNEKAIAQQSERQADSLREKAVLSERKAEKEKENAIRNAERADSTLNVVLTLKKNLIGARNYGGIIISERDTVRINGKDSIRKGIVAAEMDLGQFTWWEAKDTCEKLILNGFDDWGLPDRTELGVLYALKNVVGGFTENYYWSQNKANSLSSKAWSQIFTTGFQTGRPKGKRYYVRPIRRF